MQQDKKHNKRASAATAAAQNNKPTQQRRMLLSEPLGNIRIATTAAQRLHSLVAAETVIYGTCTRRRKNLLQRLLKEITQRNITIMVETTRHHSAVHKHTHLIAQSIAERLFGSTLLGITIWPRKHLVKLQIDIIGQLTTIIALTPRTWQQALNDVQNLAIALLVATLIPQTQHNHRATLGCRLGKLNCIPHILFKISLCITLVRMQRHLHLVGSSINYSRATCEQRAIGG